SHHRLLSHSSRSSNLQVVIINVLTSSDHFSSLVTTLGNDIHDYKTSNTYDCMTEHEIQTLNIKGRVSPRRTVLRPSLFANSPAGKLPKRPPKPASEPVQEPSSPNSNRRHGNSGLLEKSNTQTFNRRHGNNDSNGIRVQNIMLLCWRSGSSVLDNSNTHSFNKSHGCNGIRVQNIMLFCGSGCNGISVCPAVLEKSNTQSFNGRHKNSDLLEKFSTQISADAMNIASVTEEEYKTLCCSAAVVLQE
ncbi:hypothetical protein L9F63_026069, partial [Diploptera punctata]